MTIGDVETALVSLAEVEDPGGVVPGSAGVECEARRGGRVKPAPAGGRRFPVRVHVAERDDQSRFLAREGEMLVVMPSSEMHRLLENEQQTIMKDVIDPVKKDIGRELTGSNKVERGVLHVIAGAYRTGTRVSWSVTGFSRVWLVGDVDEALFDAVHAGLQPAPRR